MADEYYRTMDLLCYFISSIKRRSSVPHVLRLPEVHKLAKQLFSDVSHSLRAREVINIGVVAVCHDSDLFLKRFG